MAGTTTSTIPALIPEVYQPGVTKSFFQNNALFELFPPKPAGKGSNVTLRAQTDGTTYAAATTEGSSAPTTDISSWIKMVFAKQRFHVAIQLTHEAMDYATTEAGDPWTNEVMTGIGWLKDIAVTTMTTSLESSVGTASTYGGQTRSSYSSLLVSGADTTTEALSLGDMSTAVRTLTDADRAVPQSELVWLMSPTLAQKYAQISNQNIDAIRSITRSQGAPVDGGYGYGLTGMNFEGIDIIAIPDMTATTALCGKKSTIEIWETRQPTLSALGKDNGSDKGYIDCNYILTNACPGWWYGMTNKS